eukprot:SM000119S25668  [mRNA]  locus=s119:437219:439561:- [translate_table: standard]
MRLRPGGDGAGQPRALPLALTPLLLPFLALPLALPLLALGLAGALTVAALAMAGVATFGAISLAFAAAGLPLIGVIMLAAGFKTFSLGALTMLDSLTGVVLLFNFSRPAATLLKDYSSGAASAASKAGDSPGETLEPTEHRKWSGWLGASVLSIVPFANSVAWIVALSKNQDKLSDKDIRRFKRNFAIYTAPSTTLVVCQGFLGCCWHPAYISATFCRMTGPAWWLYPLLGAVHLQLERVNLDKAATRSLAAEEMKRPKKIRLTEEERQALEWQKQLHDFDRRLGMNISTQQQGSARTWSKTEVALWLEKLGLARYVSSFLSHSIDGPVLLCLTADEIRQELGVSSLGDRKKLIAAIEELNERVLETEVV